MSTSIEFPKFTLGADPEFVVAHENDGLVSSRDFFQNSQSGVDVECDGDCCCDDCCDCRGTVDRGEDVLNAVGMDGGDTAFEIRPMYAYTPIELVENIQQSLVSVCMTNPKIAAMDWLGGPYKHGEPLGGHIHFGISERDWNRMNLTFALDTFLAAIFINFEPEEEGKRRKSSYGRLHDVREQRWGMEYRVLSSWLESPSTANAAISLAKHIVNQAKMDETFFVKNREKFMAFFDGSDFYLQRRYNNHDLNHFRDLFPIMWSEIMSWPVEPSLELGLKTIEGMYWNNYVFSDKDFKHSWGLKFEFEIKEKVSKH